MTVAALLLHFFLAAAPTPMPVVVQNFPGPDSVAVDTLKYARLAFWATVVGGAITLIGTGFAFVDYLLNMRQFRKPKYVVALPLYPQFMSADGNGDNCVFSIKSSTSQ